MAFARIIAFPVLLLLVRVDSFETPCPRSNFNNYGQGASTVICWITPAGKQRCEGAALPPWNNPTNPPDALAMTRGNAVAASAQYIVNADMTSKRGSVGALPNEVLEVVAANRFDGSLPHTNMVRPSFLSNLIAGNTLPGSTWGAEGGSLFSFCGLDFNRFVVCRATAPIQPPLDSIQFRAISLHKTRYAACGITLSDSSIYCWGTASANYTAFKPSGRFVDVNLGYDNDACAIREEDNSVVCWPFNKVVNYRNATSQKLVQLMDGFSEYLCGVTVNSTIFCSSNSSTTAALTARVNGQLVYPTEPRLCKDPSFITRNFEATRQTRAQFGCLVTGPTGLLQDRCKEGYDVTTNGDTTCALLEDGSPLCFGTNTNIIIADWRSWSMGEFVPRVVSAPFSALALGHIHTCVLRWDGEVFCFGNAADGKLVAPIGPFVHISSNFYHTCGLMADGTAKCWGFCDGNRCAVPAGATYRYLAAGGDFTCGITWANRASCFGTYTSNTFAPAVDVVALANTLAATCAIQATGSIRCWGRGIPASTVAGQYTAIGCGASRAAQGPAEFCCATKNRTAAEVLAGSPSLVCFGGSDVIPAIPNSPNFPPNATFAKIMGAAWTPGSGTFRTACGLDAATQKLQCFGQDPDGLTSTSYTDRVIDFAVGAEHLCYINAAARLRCLGNNYHNKVTRPVTPSGAFDRIMLGSSFGCGLRTNGELLCWGATPSGYANTPGRICRSFAARFNGVCVICKLTSASPWAASCFGTNLGAPTLPVPDDAQEILILHQHGSTSTMGCIHRLNGMLLCSGTLSLPTQLQYHDVASDGSGSTCGITPDFVSCHIVGFLWQNGYHSGSDILRAYPLRFSAAFLNAGSMTARGTSPRSNGWLASASTPPWRWTAPNSRPTRASSGESSRPRRRRSSMQ